MSYTRLDDLYSLHNRLVDDYNDPDKPFEQTEEDRLLTFDLIEKIESGLLRELPCRVGDTVYGVDFTECKSKYAKTEKEKRKIFNVCTTMSGDCDKCKYSIPAVHKFVCTQIQIAEDKYTYVVGAKCENYRLENVFKTQEAAEARLKKLQEKK